MGSYKWGSKSSNTCYNYRYPTYKPYLYLPINIQVVKAFIFLSHVSVFERSLMEVTKSSSASIVFVEAVFLKQRSRWVPCASKGFGILS